MIKIEAASRLNATRLDDVDMARQLIWDYAGVHVGDDDIWQYQPNNIIFSLDDGDLEVARKNLTRKLGSPKVVGFDPESFDFKFRDPSMKGGSILLSPSRSMEDFICIQGLAKYFIGRLYN